MWCNMEKLELSVTRRMYTECYLLTLARERDHRDCCITVVCAVVIVVIAVVLVVCLKS